MTAFVSAATAIAALIFTWQSLNATRDQVKIAGDQVKIAGDQVKIAEQGQYTDRFSRAIDQLGRQGPDQLHIRLGGIYALERLARDSPRDQASITAILATFVRDSTPKRNPATGCPPTAATPAPDVQAALTVLGHRVIAPNNNTMLNLDSTCLAGADLYHADLRQTTFNGADLSGANISGADLTSSYLSGADLSGANLNGSRLDGVTLQYADLSGANLVGSSLDTTDFTGAFLYGADLGGAIPSEYTVVTWVHTDEATRGKWW